MAERLNLDTSAELNIDGIFTGHPFAFVVEQYLDDEISPLPFEGDITMDIWHDDQRMRKAATLIEGDGITVAGNRITVDRSKIKNTLKAGTYFYDIYTDIDVQNSYVIIRGAITENPSR